MKKKMIGMLLAMSMTAGMLAGCGSDGGTQSSDAGASAGSESKEESQPEADAQEESGGVENGASEAQDLTSLRGNTAPTEDEINAVNTTLNDTYLGDVFDQAIPNDYAAYPWKEEVTPGCVDGK